MSPLIIQTRILEKAEYDSYDLLVKSSSSGSIFALSGWLDATAKSLKSTYTIYGCFLNERLVAGCPIFYNNKIWFLPFISNTQGIMPYSGIIIEDISKSNVRKFEQIYREIFSSLATSLEKLSKTQIIIVNPLNILDIRPFTWRGWKASIRYSYYLDLSKLHYSRDVKRNINQAIKNGVIISKSSNIDAYYSLFQHTFERQGMKPPVSRFYLETLYKFISDNKLGEMWVASTTEEKWIAAEIFLYDQNYVHRWTAATDYNLRKNGGYHLLLDTVFKYLYGRGYKKINLMAGNTPQLTEFITGFNPNLVPYYVVCKRLFL